MIECPKCDKPIELIDEYTTEWQDDEIGITKYACCCPYCHYKGFYYETIKIIAREWEDGWE